MKNKLKKTLLGLICLLGSISMSAYDFEVDGVYYNILSDKSSVSVTYYNTDYDTYLGDISIPEKVSYHGVEYNVTQIGQKAFYNSSGLTSLVIPSTIECIGLYAFEGANHLKKVYITNLSKWCMMDLNGKYASPLSYGGTLYLNGEIVKNLESLDSSCTKIGSYSFLNLTTLESAIIPSSVLSVEEGAFQNCTGLQYLEVGENVTSLGYGAFRNCTSLSVIKLCDSNMPLEINRYEVNKTYSYFKDCPLSTVYVGRPFTWLDTTLNYAYFYPFKKVTTAIFNVDTNGFSSAFTSLKTVYIGPKCSKFNISGTSLTDLFIFNNEITNATIVSTKANIFVIDKENVPENILKLKHLAFNNLADLNNISNNPTFEYGSSINLSTENIYNHVIDMNAELSLTESNFNVGVYNDVTITFSNDLWSTTIKHPLSFTITQAPIYVIANDITRTYGEENPRLTYSCFGFKNNETEAVLDKQPQIKTSATSQSAVGKYDIIPFGAEARNYSFIYERGTLSITKAKQTIKWEQDLKNVNMGEVVGLTALSSVGLPIKYISSDETIANIYSMNGKQVVEFLKPGNVSISATQDGTENYNEAERVSKYVKVLAHASEVQLNHRVLALKVGESYQLIANVIPENTTNKTLTWESSNINIATVDGNGNITAIKAGEVWIRAISEDNADVKDSCLVSVLQSVTGIMVSPATCTIENIGETFTLTATITPADASNKEIRWTSSNSAVCVVSNGNIIAIGDGTSIVIATTVDGSFIATCSVTVDTAAGVIFATSDKREEYTIYDITGKQLNQFVKGINIIKYKNGTKQKVVID